MSIKYRYFKYTAVKGPGNVPEDMQRPYQIWVTRDSDGMEKCITNPWHVTDDLREDKWHCPDSVGAATLVELSKEAPDEWKEITKKEAFVESL